MVSLGRLSSKHRIVVISQYHMRGISGAMPDCLARKGVAERLIAASELLPSDLRLVIWDAWRPYQVQEALFEQYLASLRQEYPDVSSEDLMAEASKFVSLPSDNPLHPAPHSTGGAVDLSIIREDGKYLKMGTDFDQFTPEARTRYYEELCANGRGLCGDLPYLQNRRLLYSVMISAGFSSYPEEWWHYDYGNQWWATLRGESSAKYGLAGSESDKKLFAEL
jgi:D-alanyl-D-alanine dipeptidase